MKPPLKHFDDLIPICHVLHLEAGIILETFIASTFGYKPSLSTDTNIRKTANKHNVEVTFTFPWKWKIPSTAPSRLQYPWISPTDSFVPLVLSISFLCRVHRTAPWPTWWGRLRWWRPPPCCCCREFWILQGKLCLLGLSWCSAMYNLQKNKAKRLRIVIRINDSYCNHCQL